MGRILIAFGAALASVNCALYFGFRDSARWNGIVQASLIPPGLLLLIFGLRIKAGVQKGKPDAD